VVGLADTLTEKLVVEPAGWVTGKVGGWAGTYIRSFMPPLPNNLLPSKDGGMV
jgi:hypothetical protein